MYIRSLTPSQLYWGIQKILRIRSGLTKIQSHLYHSNILWHYCGILHLGLVSYILGFNRLWASRLSASDLSIWTWTLLYKKCLKNLSITPQPITQAWELTIPILWWILDFYHIERGLLITLEITISAYREEEQDNSFSIEIYFRRVIEGTLIPQTIKDSRIVFRYLWPNPYYQTPETETAHASSRVSVEQGELPTGF